MPDLRCFRFFCDASFPRAGAVISGCCLLLLTAGAQQERHGRGYKAPPPTATVLVTVEKAANQKPLSNASVIFRAQRNDDVSANLEMKTDPDGHASIDLLEVGSHVTVQVIAGGYATYASDFELTPDGKQLLVKLQRPRAQVSVYGESTDHAAEVRPGVQEKPRAAAGSSAAGSSAAGGNGTKAVPAGVGPNAVPVVPGPVVPGPVVPGPVTTPGSNAVPSVPGTVPGTAPGTVPGTVQGTATGTPQGTVPGSPQ